MSVLAAYGELLTSQRGFVALEPERGGFLLYPDLVLYRKHFKVELDVVGCGVVETEGD